MLMFLTPFRKAFFNQGNSAWTQKKLPPFFGVGA